MRRGPLVLEAAVRRAGARLEAHPPRIDLPDIEALAGVYYLQRFVGVDRAGYSDIRVLVSQGRVVAAMTRRADHWITNVKLGGAAGAGRRSAEIADLAHPSAAAAVEADFAGVDMLRGADGQLLRPRGQQHAGLAGIAKRCGFLHRR